jgi:lipoprotein-anchoring transpeptidase ErfK/SrfK
MRIASLLAAMAFVSAAFFSTSSQATVLAQIDLSAQTMRVYVNGELRHVWPVSTAKRGYRTPVGMYRPTTLSRFHRSSKYNWSPMPHSIFFRGGYAIHGSYDIRSLGGPASHGCVRLHPANARELFQMVKYFGPRDTRIVIHR